MVTQPP